MNEAGTAPATRRSPTRNRLGRFDPVVIELTQEAAFAYSSQNRPTARHLPRMLACRIAQLNSLRDGASGFLPGPSYSTSVRFIGTIPQDVRAHARRKRAAQTTG